MKKDKKTIKKVESELIKDINEDTDQIKKFIIILIGVALVSVILYFVSAKYVLKDNFQGDKNDTPVEENISYDRVDAGNVFNRPYEEYYVLAYDPSSLEASVYASLLKIDKDKKVYFLNLALDVNKGYIGEGNKNATNPSELSLKEPTLIKIENGTITKYLETLEAIEKELK